MESHFDIFGFPDSNMRPLEIVYGNYAPSELPHCLFIDDHSMSIASPAVIDLLSQIVVD